MNYTKSSPNLYEIFQIWCELEGHFERLVTRGAWWLKWEVGVGEARDQNEWVPGNPGLVLSNLAKAPLGLSGAAAPRRVSAHRGGVPALLPAGAGPRLREPSPTHVGTQRGWPGARAAYRPTPPGPIPDARVRPGGVGPLRRPPAPPLGHGFGFRVQTGLHSSEEARSGLIKAGKINNRRHPGRRPAGPAAATRGARRSPLLKWKPVRETILHPHVARAWQGELRGRSPFGVRMGSPFSWAFLF
ncbi:uncharacterized protein LOC125610673 [Marmota marmota marmota]|uniref:uncharacterized protein LOC125610673 n=1 Tax=Marmota marmota marmota TaxID=9994 RepID=UPI002092361F|nr:uncharacterized protein LOC125610673 [Marmota marmota marmota]